ncbi:unnamed protein product [Rotaria sp. Silwood1]|nr:unnamed protein product [Rotaria sp. Silwood1]CAF0896181.1 unnamed protein product [Rotaria sp. Silwood1]CAF0910041.1 unnamed protein product [Rotaria sp. Silwood1]CAF3373155.1 unnamed protein product [Rotaria sp. Silwood1]CAF3375900.1 unnamed protein product [Rotaria sp. Silwood1]
MNTISIAVLTIILGEIFLFSFMIISTLIIYYHFAQPNEPTIDIDSIEMSDQNENIIPLKSQLEQFQ